MDVRATTQPPLHPVQDRSLDRICSLCRQAEHIGDKLQAMLGRYHGDETGKSAEQDWRSGYLGQINDLSDRLERIGKLVDTLAEIA